MLTRVKQPLHGKPETVEEIDLHGKPSFSIVVRELTPARAIVADGAAKLFAWALFGWFAVLLFQHPGTPALGEGIAACVGAYLSFFAFRGMAQACLRRKTLLVITTDLIRVKRLLSWDGYRREIEHRFALLNHDGMQDEQQRLDYQQRKASARGQVIRKQSYYDKSFHVVLLYAGYRVDLVDVFGQKEAAAIVARLQYCDRRLNDATGAANGVAHSPADDWDHVPGGLYDE